MMGIEIVRSCAQERLEEPRHRSQIIALSRYSVPSTSMNIPHRLSILIGFGHIELAELHGDLFSRHACLLEGAVFFLWRPTKQS